NETGEIIGKASREECHGNPALLHRTAHVVVYHPDGRVLLQKRRMDKDIQPGKWDTAVGGHVDAGETIEQAARRELAEELEFKQPIELKHLFDSKIRNEVESENVRVYAMTHPGPFEFQKEEIDEVRFWAKDELESAAESSPEIFTPNLLAELKQLGYNV
ncbi:MAG: NUDIX domain-containing protein, partial [Victivallales bacterium]|nr:NUDIX domain-containing protein [Victivallales bacterium]